MTTPAQIDEAVTIITDLIKIGAIIYPPMAVASPILTSVVQAEAANIKAGLASGNIIPDGKGGFVTKTWANDPRHAIGQDGNFVDKSL